MIFKELQTKDLLKHKNTIISLFEQINNMEYSVAVNRFEQLISYFKSNRANMLACFLNDEVLIGYIWYFYREQNFIHINSFIVDNRYRSEGVGSKLMEIFIKMYNDKRIDLKVDDFNFGAIKFYKRYGFIHTGNKSMERIIHID